MTRGIGIIAAVIAAVALTSTAMMGCRKKPAERETGPAPTTESPHVQAWDVISREQADLPEISRDELLTQVQEWVEAARRLPSWEAHYEAGFTQTSPSVRETARVRMASAGRKWVVHLLTNPDEAQPMQTRQVACDGNTVRIIWPDGKHAQLLKAGEPIGFGSAPTLPAFLPQLSSEDALREGVDVRDMLGMLDDPETRLSPSCTRVDSNPCYVLERTQILEYPVLQNQEEADQWLREHAEEEISADGSLRPLIVVNPDAKPNEKITRMVTMRLAVDPKLGFAIVRWARGCDMQMLGRPISIFPDREVVYHNFRKVGDALYLPARMEFNICHAASQGGVEIFQQFTLDVGEISVRPQYEEGLFEPVIPEGYAIADMNRGITYTAGESQEKLDVLIATAKNRDTFYRHLQEEGPAPSLEASMWIGSEPVDLREHKGRSIILHFWGIDCAPCMHELPRLQNQYGNTMRNTGEPLFVSVHPYVDGAELEEVRKVIKDRNITYPVMIDSADTAELSWGRTFYKYRIFGIPSEISIDESGRVVGEVERALISEDSWWIDKRQDK